jgi:hypothetical protein
MPFPLKGCVVVVAILHFHFVVYRSTALMDVVNSLGRIHDHWLHTIAEASILTEAFLKFMVLLSRAATPVPTIQVWGEVSDHVRTQCKLGGKDFTRLRPTTVNQFKNVFMPSLTDMCCVVLCHNTCHCQWDQSSDIL